MNEEWGMRSGEGGMGMVMGNEDWGMEIREFGMGNGE